MAAWAGLMLAGLAILGLTIKAFLAAEPRQLARMLRWLGWAALIAGVGALVAARRLDVLISLASLGIILAGRGRWLFGQGWPWSAGRPGGRAGPGHAGPAGQRSTVETASLAMWLDHASGAMDGEVRVGPARGRRLGELTREELRGLWDLINQTDPNARPLLEAWLDRTQGDDWRADFRDCGPGGRTTGSEQGDAMTRERALAVLGLAEGATETDIREAHRRLMQRVHPDHGGTDDLAARINQARAVLLGDRRN